MDARPCEAAPAVRLVSVPLPQPATPRVFPHDTTVFLGIRVSVVGADDTIAFITDAAARRAPALVANVNAFAMYLARHHAAFAAVLNGADRVFCDGAGVKALAGLSGIRLGERMTPRDWIDALFERCADQGLSVFLLGGPEGLAAECARTIAGRHPRLRLAGWHHGFFDPHGEDGTRLERSIADRNADIILVGMGMPWQELWASEAMARVGRGVFIPVGGLFKQYVGAETVCPRWLSRWGVEWAWRFAHDPARLWRRYLVGNTSLVLQAGYAAVVKPILDVSLAAILLCACAPLLATLAVGIRIDSPGPAFFAQERVGKFGRRFRMWKLRTLSADFPPQARKRSIRATDTTRMGNWLRRTAIDELPQLLNVLRGEMSLVGPRPEMPFIASDERVDSLRLSVKPGMTGLWQVARLRGDLADREIHDDPAFDLEYTRRIGARLDLAILWQTAVRLLTMPFERTWRSPGQIPADVD